MGVFADMIYQLKSPDLDHENTLENPNKEPQTTKPAPKEPSPKVQKLKPLAFRRKSSLFSLNNQETPEALGPKDGVKHFKFTPLKPLAQRKKSDTNSVYLNPLVKFNIDVQMEIIREQQKEKDDFNVGKNFGEKEKNEYMQRFKRLYQKDKHLSVLYRMAEACAENKTHQHKDELNKEVECVDNK